MIVIVVIIALYLIEHMHSTIRGGGSNQKIW